MDTFDLFHLYCPDFSALDLSDRCAALGAALHAGREWAADPKGCAYVRALIARLPIADPRIVAFCRGAEGAEATPGKL